ncbi:MAG: 30S ribosomal protein S2 [Candidatus Jordarchaeaceae archaeon]
MSEPELLIPLDKYLAAGVHIGTQVKTKSMEPFIYRVRSDGLYVLDIRKTDERIRIAGRFLARFEPARIALVSARQYGQRPVRKFSSIIRANTVAGRFIPGIFTNPALNRYIEPDVIMLTDPRADSQALTEAAKARIPVVALCDTDNSTEHIDLVIPSNNKGRKALSLVYWLLAQQVLRERGEIPPDGELPVSVDEFEAKVKR